MAGASGNVQVIKNAGGDDHDRNNMNEAAREKTQNMLQERIDNKEEQITKIEATVFQVANYYFVFQGVIINAIVNGSSHSSSFCRHCWLPLSLTILGAILNISTLYATAQKYKKSLDDLHKRKLVWYRYVKGDQSLNLEDNQTSRQIKMWMFMSLLVIFALVNLFASILIPCNYGIHYHD